MYEQAQAVRTIYGEGRNLLICGDVMKLPREVRALKGKVQCVYLDPPFMTGEVFKRKRPYGEKGWRKGSPSLTLEGYADRFEGERGYLRFLRRIVTVSRDLLKDEGIFYLHLDWRMSARGRMLCDQIFGAERFLNEIIWAYESGGRNKRMFSRKHDTILMYARSENYHFDLTQVPLARGQHRKNHMARKVDENGRSYSSIVSGGKEYRYYDDEPVYPGDVWTDIGFLQQKDPERTGYPTQKPKKLLERLLKPVARPGELVADLCCGSGTTLAAAETLGCFYLGMDVSAEAVSVCQNRLKAENLTVICPTETDGVSALSSYDSEAGRLRMGGMDLRGDPWPESTPGEDLVEAWEIGRMAGKTFRVQKRYQRSFQYPALIDSLAVNPEKIPDILMTDAAGARRAYRWRNDPEETPAPDGTELRKKRAEEAMNR